MQHEQFEINTSYFHLYVNLNEAAVAPPGECLPHTEIFRRLAGAMGYDEPELFATDEEIARDVLDLPHFAQAGVTLESLRVTGFARLPASSPYTPFAESFPTPSGRFEFVSSAAALDGHGLLPSYEPPSEAVAEGEGLALVAAASEHHISSTFAGTDRIRSRGLAPTVMLHPADAADRGISAGVAERDTDMARGPVFHDNRVFVERAEAQPSTKPR